MGTGYLWALQSAWRQAQQNLRSFSIGCVVSAVCILGAEPGLSQDDGRPQGSSESTAAPRIEILHSPLKSNDIPPVGSLMRIQFTLTNTVDIESKIRLVGSKDGRFIDLAFPQGALNSGDRPVFSVEIPSPVAVMTYQFILHQKDGSLSTTPKYTVKRDCIQNFQVDVPDDGSTTTFRREMASLVAKAHSLDRDNKSLESSLKLVEQMKASLSR